MTLFTLIIISLSAKLTSSAGFDTMNYDKHCKTILEKRHGDPVNSAFWKHGELSEKSSFVRCFLYKFTEKSVRELYLDGLYIAGHKYFGKDPMKGSAKPELFKKFPSPEVTIDRKVVRHVWLEMACKKSGKDCVNGLYNFGGHKSGTIRNFLVSYDYCPYRLSATAFFQYHTFLKHLKKNLMMSAFRIQKGRPMGKPTICIGDNKGADQLRSNCEVDQRLCFRYSDSTVPLLLSTL